MNKVTRYIPIGVILFVLLSCSAFPSGRVEEPSGKQEARVFWVLDGSMSTESAEMFLERYLLPTSVAAMLWTEFTLQGNEVRLDTQGGYRVVRKQRVLTEPIGAYVVHGYDLIIDVTRSSSAPPPAGSRAQSADSYVVRFSYPESADSGSGSTPKAVQPSGVLPQPLQQALLAGIREDGRTSGKARVQLIEYLGSGRFRATVLVGD